MRWFLKKINKDKWELIQGQTFLDLKMEWDRKETNFELLLSYVIPSLLILICIMLIAIITIKVILINGNTYPSEMAYNISEKWLNNTCKETITIIERTLLNCPKS